jgi:hypothetical protein
VREFLGRLRTGLVVAGVALALVGVLGLALGWGSSSATTVTVRSSGETPQAFLASFVAALRGGNQSFLFDRLDPAVIARYGTAQCQAYVPELFDPNASLQLVKVTGPATFDYATDGRSTQVQGVYTFTVQGTVAGRTGTRDYHLALVNGRYRIFVDCGTPPAGS